MMKECFLSNKFLAQKSRQACQVQLLLLKNQSIRINRGNMWRANQLIVTIFSKIWNNKTVWAEHVMKTIKTPSNTQSLQYLPD